MSMSSGYSGGSPGFSGGSPSGLRLDAINQAWGIVQKNLVTWIVAALIYLAITGVIVVLQNMVEPHRTAQGTTGGSPAVSLMLSLLSFAVSSLLMGGLYRMALKELRGQTASPGDIFSATDVLPALLGSGILVPLAVGLGFLLCILPGIYMAPLLLFVPIIVADQRVGAVDGFKRSWNALKPHWGSAFLFSFALGIVNLVGALLCGVGLLVTWPISIVALAIVYNDFFGGGANTFNNNANLYPPIPNIPQ